MNENIPKIARNSNGEVQISFAGKIIDPSPELLEAAKNILEFVEYSDRNDKSN